jgi:hypothetical protein
MKLATRIQARGGHDFSATLFPDWKVLRLLFAYDQVARPLLGITGGGNGFGSTHHLFGPIQHHDSSCKLPTVSGSASG